MVTQANHNRDPILNFNIYYMVLRRPSQYSTTQNHSCSLMVVRAITVRPTALLHMTSNIIVLRRPSLCSPTQTLSCSQMVTPAGQNNNTYCQITLILMYYDDHRGMPRLAIFPAHLWCCARAITASCGFIAFDLTVLRRSSPYSTIRNLACPAMVTQAGHANSSFCSTILSTIVLLALE